MHVCKTPHQMPQIPARAKDLRWGGAHSGHDPHRASHGQCCGGAAFGADGMISAKQNALMAITTAEPINHRLALMRAQIKQLVPAEEVCLFGSPARPQALFK